LFFGARDISDKSGFIKIFYTEGLTALPQTVIIPRILKAAFFRAWPFPSLSSAPLNVFALRPFPGMNKGSFLGFIKCRIPSVVKDAIGFQIYRKDNDKQFFHFNVMHQDALTPHKGRMLWALFNFHLPEVPELDTPEAVWNVNVLGCDGKAHIVGMFNRVGGHWRFTPYPRWSDRCIGDLQKKVREPRYVFAGGPPKSGTTWVEKILNSHPRILCNGEGNFFHVPLKVKISQQNNWLPENTEDTDFGLLHQAGAAEKVFRAMNALWPQEIFVDRSPSYSSCYFKVMAALPDAKVIHCRRHPLDVAVSRIFHEFNLLRTGKPISMGATVEEIECAKAVAGNPDAPKGALFEGNEKFLYYLLDEWIQAEVNFEHTVRRYPGCGIVMVYEQLLENQKDEIARLMAFMGIKTSQRKLDAIVLGTRFKSLSGGREAGDQDTVSFFRKGIAGDYLNHFSPEQIEMAKSYLHDKTNPEVYAYYFGAIA
jgi:hypothetical protein